MYGTPTSTALVALSLAYLLGSLSSAVLVCRALNLPDPRGEGSGNPGATNVLRIGGLRAALLTLTGDMLKGFLPVWIATGLGLPPLWIGATGVAAVLGHLLPLFFRFRGGKGVATMLGVCLAYDWRLGLLQIGCWLLLAALFRISSLSALVTALLTPALAYWLAPDYLAFCSLLALLLVLRHHRNILNLRRGEEKRL